MPILYLILLVQVVFLTVINLFYLERYLAYDSSAVYLQLQEMVEQQTFFIENWVYTSTLTWDTPLLFAYPLYDITGKLYASFGIAILLSIFLFLWVADALLTQLNASHKAKVLFAICALTPYVNFEDSFNRIDYYAVMLSIFGVYILKTAITLLVWVVFLRHDRPSLGEYRLHYNKTTTLLTALTLFSCFFTAVSSGYHVLLFGIVPPLLYSIFRNVIRDTWKPHNCKALFFLFGTVAVSVLGKMVNTHVIGHGTHESNLGWTEVTYFWQNFFSIFEGYLVLTGALPHWESPPAFSPLGIAYAFLLSLSLGLLVTGVGSMVKSIKKKEDNLELYYSVLFFIMLLMFVFIYTKYGAHFFETRYLIPNFILLLLFSSIWLSNQLDGTNKSLRIFLSITVIPCIIVTNTISYYYIYQSQADLPLKYEVIDYISTHQSPVVHVTGYDCMIQGQNLRVLDREKTYIWSARGEQFTYSGDYTYYLETSEYDGPTLLLTSTRDFENLPYYIQYQFEEIHTFSALFTLYESKHNPMDYAVGITDHDYNVDYPYSYGLNTADYGNFWDAGDFYVVGHGSFVCWGPDLPAPAGEYDITLHYQVLSAPDPLNIGFLSFTLDQGATLLAKEYLTYGGSSVTLKSVNLNDVVGRFYEYRILAEPEVELLIHSIEIQRVAP